MEITVIEYSMIFYIFRSLIPLLPTLDSFSDSDDDNTEVLEHIFIGVTLLVVILVIILVYVTFKTRLSQNRFKLLDNSGEH